MHETIISEKIIDAAKAQGEVEEITLEVGELAHLPTPELIACLKELVSWKINYSELKSKVKCECGFTGNPKVLERGHDSFLIECPNCKSNVMDILEGKDINLVSVKVR
ncbi:hydrogenase maturation nickel metallochaperone HypA [Candidatus Woesearchaeota archaeon]|nr:hydrogenase maturation nickel metallochaperone HypA [Candidatus Woesearchaeota archaeon]